MFIEKRVPLKFEHKITKYTLIVYNVIFKKTFYLKAKVNQERKPDRNLKGVFVQIEIYMPHCEYDSYKELSYTFHSIKSAQSFAWL